MINPNIENINIVEPYISEHRWVGERNEIIKLERKRYELVLGGITKPLPLPIFISILNSKIKGSHFENLSNIT
jgi:hypothetical protein